MKKIGIFGGVFNPPHNSHLNVAEEILTKDKNYEKVIFVPVGNKYKKNDLIDAEYRYDMLKLACEDRSALEVSRLEIDQAEQFYAYQTLDEFKKEYPNHELTFIIGTDSFKTLDTWKNLDYLLTNYSFLIYPRGKDNFYEILNNSEILKKYSSKINFLDTDSISDLSSTLVRNTLKDNLDVSNLLPKKVLKYIKKNELYK